jgi:hypothetical protein
VLPFRPRLEALENRCLPSTLTVLNTNDSGPGSLRGEIAAAQNGDTIVFDPGLAGQTIQLTSGELVIDKDLDIEGPGSNNLQMTISGEHFFGGVGFRVFEIDGSVTVTLANLGITNGCANQGAGVLNAGGNLTLSRCDVHDNFAIGNSTGSDAMGGGVCNASGSLTVLNSLVENNLAAGMSVSGSPAGNGLGGGVYNAAGASLTITGGGILGNGADGGIGSLPGNGLGGGIDAAGGSITISRTAFDFNDAVAGSNGSYPSVYGVGLGGTIYVAGGTLNLTNSSVLRGEAASGPGGLARGGAIYQAGGNLVLTNNSFAANAVDIPSDTSSADNAGGAIYQAGGNLTLTNDEFINNNNPDNPSIAATGQGGAIDVAGGDLTIQNCFFTENAAETGGAICITGGIVCISKNTTFNDNTASTDPDVFGSFTIC